MKTTVWKSIALVLVSLHALLPIAHAEKDGNGVGGGGDVVLCRVRSGKAWSSLKPYLADSALLLMKKELPEPREGVRESDYLDQILAVIRLRDEPFADALAERIRELKFEEVAALEELDDDNIELAKFQTEDTECRSKQQLAIQNIETRKVRVASHLYKKLSLLERALFKVHEGYVSLKTPHMSDTAAIRNAVEKYAGDKVFTEFLASSTKMLQFFLQDAPGEKKPPFRVFFAQVNKTLNPGTIFKDGKIVLPGLSFEARQQSEARKRYFEAFENLWENLKPGERVCSLARDSIDVSKGENRYVIPKGARILFWLDPRTPYITLWGDTLKDGEGNSVKLGTYIPLQLSCYEAGDAGRTSLKRIDLRTLDLERSTNGVLEPLQPLQYFLNQNKPKHTDDNASDQAPNATSAD